MQGHRRLRLHGGGDLFHRRRNHLARFRAAGDARLERPFRSGAGVGRRRQRLPRRRRHQEPAEDRLRRDRRLQIERRGTDLERAQSHPRECRGREAVGRRRQRQRCLPRPRLHRLGRRRAAALRAHARPRQHVDWRRQRSGRQHSCPRLLLARDRRRRKRRYLHRPKRGQRYQDARLHGWRRQLPCSGVAGHGHRAARGLATALEAEGMAGVAWRDLSRLHHAHGLRLRTDRGRRVGRLPRGRVANSTTRFPATVAPAGSPARRDSRC